MSLFKCRNAFYAIQHQFTYKKMKLKKNSDPPTQIFSSPEPKAQVSYCHSAPSVVRRRPSVNFHIFNFFSETVERNTTKVDRRQDLNTLYQVCVFQTDRKNNMAAPVSDWLRHILLLL